ncbi:hypothetical protein PUN28_012830 [Cardiocondyla obscurior]|uniref:Uncharacterized protein n=1 Tax=Cardiocondyla obscurior TaxID=286306 RepID=A0AAW2FB43_9HYME
MSRMNRVRVSPRMNVYVKDRLIFKSIAVTPLPSEFLEPDIRCICIYGFISDSPPFISRTVKKKKKKKKKKKSRLLNALTLIKPI